MPKRSLWVQVKADEELYQQVKALDEKYHILTTCPKCGGHDFIIVPDFDREDMESLKIRCQTCGFSPTVFSDYPVEILMNWVDRVQELVEDRRKYKNIYRKVFLLCSLLPTTLLYVLVLGFGFNFHPVYHGVPALGLTLLPLFYSMKHKEWLDDIFHKIGKDNETYIDRWTENMLPNIMRKLEEDSKNNLLLPKGSSYGSDEQNMDMDDNPMEAYQNELMEKFSSDYKRISSIMSDIQSHKTLYRQREIVESLTKIQRTVQNIKICLKSDPEKILPAREFIDKWNPRVVYLASQYEEISSKEQDIEKKKSMVDEIISVLSMMEKKINEIHQSLQKNQYVDFEGEIGVMKAELFGMEEELLKPKDYDLESQRNSND